MTAHTNNWYVSFKFCFVQVCRGNPNERSRFIRCIYNLLNSSSPAVRYEAAGTLVTLSSAPTAITVSSAVFYAALLYFIYSVLLDSTPLYSHHHSGYFF